MNVRLQTLLAEAEALPEPEQDVLADIIEDFIADPEGAARLSAEELAEIDAMLAAPLDLADQAEVDAVLGPRAPR